MPDICYNSLYIIGHKEDLDEIEAAKFSFQEFVPRPADQEENWYEWNNANWGTKWDRGEYILNHRSDNQLAIGFQTAWCPPLKVLEAVLKKYPRSWMKLTYSSEDNASGVWIGHMATGELTVQQLHWIQPEPRLTTKGEILIL
jgi:Ferredoxin-like domain in Api92-like protein